MANKIKLDKSAYIKTLFFADKKPNMFYMIITHNNTKPEKGIIWTYYSILEAVEDQQ